MAGPALSGVLIDEDGQSRFVRRGERVGDWTLDSLQDRAAAFVRGAERRSIELPVTYADADAAATPPSPGRPAARSAAPAARTPAAPPAAAPRPAPAAPAAAAPAPAPAPAPAAAAPPAGAARPALSTGSFGGSVSAPPPAPAKAPR
ncbi:hypothetical protein H0I39_06460 [Ottowia beijingensis]|uniref:Uncharacterized protein n=1 Tax=Ottowia beijingensis TaxID=1207057 RepID=A0A853IM47_9BURK|nr:hypothetical protein [Ottowia beijingensis]NZA01496.1 hypothetical protein [Ottowia beijingensis]